jgi:hypothetical protein
MTARCDLCGRDVTDEEHIEGIRTTWRDGRVQTQRFETFCEPCYDQEERTMPLDKSGSDKSVGKNIKAEVHAGKPRAQAIAIALDVQRRAQGKKGK